MTEDQILKLSGGGDWHVAYILLYAPRRLEKMREEEEEEEEEVNNMAQCLSERQTLSQKIYCTNDKAVLY